MCFSSSGLAEDFKTLDGREYKDATVNRVEPDGIVLITSSGVSKVYFVELARGAAEEWITELKQRGVVFKERRSPDRRFICRRLGSRRSLS